MNRFSNIKNIFLVGLVGLWITGSCTTPTVVHADFMDLIPNGLIPKNVHIDGDLLTKQSIYTAVIAGVGGAFVVKGVYELFPKPIDSKNADDKQGKKLSEKNNDRLEEPESPDALSTAKQFVTQITKQTWAALGLIVGGVTLFLKSNALASRIDRMVTPVLEQPSQ